MDLQRHLDKLLSGELKVPTMAERLARASYIANLSDEEEQEAERGPLKKAVSKSAEKKGTATEQSAAKKAVDKSPGHKAVVDKSAAERANDQDPAKKNKEDEVDTTHTHKDTNGTKHRDHDAIYRAV
jgi:hypothetical protein